MEQSNQSMQKSNRRRDSIIPLSREHHYALLLCLRIHRGVEKHKSNVQWAREQMHKTVSFFDSDLIPHFQAEETVLFPAMAGMEGCSVLIAALLEEHEEMRRRIEYFRRLENSGEPQTLFNNLNNFADFLEAHIRKEERQLFPLYEKQVTMEVDGRVGAEILNRLGSGLQPKHPEFLD